MNVSRCFGHHWLRRRPRADPWPAAEIMLPAVLHHLGSPRSCWRRKLHSGCCAFPCWPRHSWSSTNREGKICLLMLWCFLLLSVLILRALKTSMSEESLTWRETFHKTKVRKNWWWHFHYITWSLWQTTLLASYPVRQSAVFTCHSLWIIIIYCSLLRNVKNPLIYTTSSANTICSWASGTFSSAMVGKTTTPRIPHRFIMLSNKVFCCCIEWKSPSGFTCFSNKQMKTI